MFPSDVPFRPQQIHSQRHQTNFHAPIPQGPHHEQFLNPNHSSFPHPPFPHHHSYPDMPMNYNQSHQFSQQQFNPAPLPHLDLAQALSRITDRQEELFASLKIIQTRLDSEQRAPITSINQLASNLGGIDLNREVPPHQRQPVQTDRPSYFPQPPIPSRVSTPSEGAFARDRQGHC